MSYPDFLKRQIISLDGIWDFCWLGKNADRENIQLEALSYQGIMTVPGVFDTTPEFSSMRGVGVFRKKFCLRNKSERLKLKIGGMGLLAKIWFDNVFIAEYNLPYSGVEYDLPGSAVDAEECEIVIAVDNRFDEVRMPFFLPHYDFYAFGGIYRSIEIHHLPAYNINRVQVTPLNIHDGTVRLDIKLEGNVPSACELALSFDGRKSEKFKCQPVKEKIKFETKVPDFKVWSPGNPHLHTVTVDIGHDEITERFGIRTISTEDGKILLNDRPLKLHGFNRHESHPQFGPVQPMQLMLEDLQWLKKMNCNFIRCVHYPQDQRFLDLCDQLGFLVWEESLGWGNSAGQLSDPAFISGQEKQTRQMVRNSCNHPSVIIWGFLNEAESHKPEAIPLYRQLAAALREEDSSRLVSYASCRNEKDICFEFADVISMNIYPGWIGEADKDIAALEYIEPSIKKLVDFASGRGYENKPFLITEIGACALYGCHDINGAQWTEEFQRDYMAEALRVVMNSPRISGVSLWQMFDTRSFGPYGKGVGIRGKPRGYNCAGVLDEYRRPKLACAEVGRIYGMNK